MASDGSPAIDDTDPYSYDASLTNAYKPGGISDDGKAATYVSTAPNLDAGDTNHYADAFVRRFGGGGGSSGSGDPYTVTATGAQPDNLRIDLVFRCGSVSYPVAVALKPDSVTGTSASWSVNVDPSLIGACPPGSGLVAIANDGFSISESFLASTQPVLESQAPAPTIYGPAPGDAYSTYLQYSTVTLDGTARDAEDGVLPGSRLDWFITPPGGPEAPAGTGTSVRRDHHQRVGGHQAFTRCACSPPTRTENSTSTTSSFTVLEDKDNDGVPVLQDRIGETGAGCSAVSGSGDNDPSNAYLDPDGDGVSSVDEVAFSEQPCVVATGGTAGAATLRIDPNPVPTSSGNPVTGYLTVANAAETQVLANSLRLRLTATTAAGVTGHAEAGLVRQQHGHTLHRQVQPAANPRVRQDIQPVWSANSRAVDRVCKRVGTDHRNNDFDCQEVTTQRGTVEATMRKSAIAVAAVLVGMLVAAPVATAAPSTGDAKKACADIVEGRVNYQSLPDEVTPTSAEVLAQMDSAPRRARTSATR